MSRCYYVYILASRSRNLYTGVTNSLRRRIIVHREGPVPGFTTRYRIFRLVHYEVFRDIRLAIAREKEIKGWGRKKKVRLIQRTNRTWQDLAADWYARVQMSCPQSLRTGSYDVRLAAEPVFLLNKLPG